MDQKYLQNIKLSGIIENIGFIVLFIATLEHSILFQKMKKLQWIFTMKTYNETYGKKLIDSLHNNLNYLLEDIENIEDKEFLIISIQSNLHHLVEIELKGTVPREIVNKYVNLVFLSFHA
ncbi:MAG: hypothetical protein GY822_01830 [Deltaproteobacteria bacterium]|nr:hypothetical protein [Deltaproteobacteria bacterium]